MELGKCWLGLQDVDRIVVSGQTFCKRLKSQLPDRSAKGRTRVQDGYCTQERLRLDTRKNFLAGRGLGLSNCNPGKSWQSTFFQVWNSVLQGECKCSSAWRGGGLERLFKPEELGWAGTIREGRKEGWEPQVYFSAYLNKLNETPEMKEVDDSIIAYVGE